MRKGNKSVSSTTLRLVVVLWFTSAVFGTIVNKIVMKSFHFPITFTAMHLSVGGILDYFIIWQRSGKRSQFRMAVFRACALNGTFFALNKAFTYMSYVNIPLSLTHTVKSSAPVFSVLTTTFWMRQCVPIDEIVTLIPIIVGVTLSTVTELNFELLGFACAFTSTLLGALQNTSGKIVMSFTSNLKCDPVEMHMYGAMIAMILLLPLIAIFELKDLKDRILPAPLKALTEGDVIEVKGPAPEPVPYEYILISTVVLYFQTIASLTVLKRVSTVTHQVTNTFKRLLIIVLSIVYFQNEVTAWNYFGVLLALTGFMLYGYRHSVNKQRKSVLQNEHRIKV